MLLIITGKGAAAGGGVTPLAADARSDRQRGDEGSAASAPRGVLRRVVPEWLDEPELRPFVLSYAEAGVRHGGAGALYVRLRKAREDLKRTGSGEQRTERR
jgi:hypothetical protein